MGDPWILLLLPLVLALPIGLAAGGAIGAATVALIGGALLLFVVLGIASLAASLLHLAVRDRRRGELLTLLFIVVLPTLALLPSLMGESRPRDERGRRAPRPSFEQAVPGWVSTAGERVFAAMPTELYVHSTRQASRGQVTGIAVPLLGLAAIGLLLHGLGMRLFNRVLDSPGSTGSRRSAPMRAIWGRTLPLLSAPASAVALAHLRLAMRTPRGRSIMMTPLLFVAIFGLLMYRGGGSMAFGPFRFQSGLSLATFVSFSAFLQILPLAMNQFAVDKAGLTLALLSPLTERDYLIGKAVGNMLVIIIPAGIATLLSAAVFPGGSPALWLSLPLALLAMALVSSPVAAILSAIFPRVVDMNSISRGSNAHGLAGLLGMLTYLAAGVPCLLIVLLATRWLHQPWLAPALLLAWCAVAFGISLGMFALARRVFAERRENFAMLF